MNRKVLILKTGSARPELISRYGDFENWISALLPDGVPAVEILDVRQPGFEQKNPQDSVILITGSHDNITDQPFYLTEVMNWLKSAVKMNIPVLGICYGHQLLAATFGGNVDFNPNGYEVGPVQISLSAEAEDDPLFRSMPKQFGANLSHLQSVRDLPAGASVLAFSAWEPVQAFRLLPGVYGVQFHPEFSGEIMHDYIRLNYLKITSAKQNPEALIAGLQPAPSAAGIVREFYRLFGQAE